jgi:hypothetical protein
MRFTMRQNLLALAFAGVLLAAPAQAEIIELADGRTLQGEIVSGQTTDDGLAVRIFETGGVVVVKWEHVLAERAKELRVEYGIDIPEDESVTVTGHVVTLTNGTQVRGVAENARQFEAGEEGTLRVKTPNGLQTYERSAVGRVVAVEIEALEAYTKEELYARELADNPPESPAAHFALGDFCQRIGDYAHAKEHYEEAAKDADFVSTNDGKSLEQRIRRADVLIRAAGAQELVAAINRAKYAKKWNDALAKLIQLDEEYEDQQIRDAIGFDRLENQVVRGRDEFFKKRVQRVVYDAMEKMIERKVREKKPLRATEDGDGLSGTLAGARQWAARQLPTELWDKVAADLGLEKDEVDRFWSERTSRRVRTGNYGTGSFIVIKRATLPGGDNRRRRPPPGSRSRSSGGGGGSSKASQPKTDEQWWDSVRPADRARWLEAYFVENSGIFEIIRTDESELCSNCAGKGFLAIASSEGGESQTYCPQCNGSGKFKKVMYR